MRHGCFWAFCAWFGVIHPLAFGEIQYISKSQVEFVEQQFQSAKDFSDIAWLNQTSWLCELIGAKSRMQKQMFQKFYAFKTLDNKSKLENSGGHSVRSFHVVNQQLIGETKTLREQIRYDSQNQKMISLIFEKGQPEILLAVATCERA